MPIVQPVFSGLCVPVIFAVDSHYISQLGVALTSLVDHASKDSYYDIVILTNDIPQLQRNILYRYFACSNISLRFYDVSTWLSAESSAFHIHNWGKTWHSKSVYFRFLIPEIFSLYDKVIYLDVDLVITEDIKKLYDIELRGNYVGAVQDLSRNLKGDKVAEYIENTLHVPSSQYFNGGVLLMNIKLMKGKNFCQCFMECLHHLGKPWLQDQDVFNVVFKGRVLYLNRRFNSLLWSPLHCQPKYEERMPTAILEDAKDAAENPVIVHYAGIKKPWKEPQLALAHWFWEYARRSPFYEQILYDNLKGVPQPTPKPSSAHQPAPKPLPSTPPAQVIRDTEHLFSLRLRYLRCRILTELTRGHKRIHYRTKKRYLRARLQRALALLKSIR